ncbi:MAG: prepilin-type N-terminal cleavage/methylation domain-containing protein, partial [Candidatus Paceibacterota bacterium]
MKEKGFTLIELLVIIAIIAILATIVVTLLGPARLKAKDAAVSSVLASYRTQAQLVFAGDFMGLCSSPSFMEIELYIQSEGGTIASCEDGNNSYRIVAGLPSVFAVTIPATAYAAQQDGWCVNSLGESKKVTIAKLKEISSPSCGGNAPQTEEPAGGFTTMGTSNYVISCVN